MESGRSVGAVRMQGTCSSYYSTGDKIPIGGTSLELYKVDNNAKVRGQILNELDIMNASFGHPQ